MKRIVPLAAAAVAAVVALSGCGTSGSGSSSTSPSGMDHGQMTSSTPSATATAAAGHNEADVMFAQMMIPHHQQAVEMSDILLAKTGLDPQVKALAERIKAAQAPEIETMNGWLSEWNQPTMMADDAAAGGHGMEGMMSAGEMDELRAADAAEASRLFLDQMIGHHEGAVEMAKQEVENGSNAEAVELAGKVVQDQEAEIEEMKGLLGSL